MWKNSKTYVCNPSPLPFSSLAEFGHYGTDSRLDPDYLLDQCSDVSADQVLRPKVPPRKVKRMSEVRTDLLLDSLCHRRRSR